MVYKLGNDGKVFCASCAGVFNWDGRISSKVMENINIDYVTDIAQQAAIFHLQKVQGRNCSVF
jgi:hypothetical protein